MNKPNNYDNVSTGEFTPAEVGGHHMIIKQVKEQQSRTGKNMLVVAVDFAPNDKQPKYFSNLFETDTRPEKKWPNAGVIYIVSTDNSGQCSRGFKTFITIYEKSNGVTVDWCEGAKFTKQFAGKKIGGVYGIVEEEYNGKRTKRSKLRWFCEDSKAESAKVPDPQLMEQGAAPVPASTAVSSSQGFTPVEIDTDDLPF